MIESALSGRDTGVVMTQHLVLSLDLNENDLDALHLLLARPSDVANFLSPQDVRAQARLIDLIGEIAEAVNGQLRKQTPS